MDRETTLRFKLSIGKRDAITQTGNFFRIFFLLFFFLSDKMLTARACNLFFSATYLRLLERFFLCRLQTLFCNRY